MVRVKLEISVSVSGLLVDRCGNSNVFVSCDFNIKECWEQNQSLAFLDVKVTRSKVTRIKECREQNQSLAFLDVKVTRNKDNTISTTIYKKPTHTDRYFQFDSHHPKHHKFAVAKTLHNRIDTHVTNSDDKATLHKQMQHTLTLNEFPRRFSCLALKEKPRRPINSFQSFTCLPYIHGTTDKIQRVLNDVGVKVAMRPFVTIGKSLPFPKDPLDVNEITGIIYQVPCHDCPFVYIGQTKRDLQSRLSEHKRAIKYQRPEKSALCENSITLDHIIDWNEATILSTEKDYTKRLFAESWLINKSSNVINRNDGNTLPSVCKKLL